MNESQISGRLGWLSVALASQRYHLTKIFLRLKEIGVRVGTNLALHRKFMKLMEQISIDREKELDILNEIETMEKRHGEMRQRRLLRRASTEPSAKTKQTLEREEEKPEQRMGVLTLFGLLYLFSGKPIKHKNQDLTVD